MARRTTWLAGSLLLTLGACATSANNEELVDGGNDVAVDDATRADTGTPPVDVGTPPVDVGTPPVDVGTPPVDVGTAPIDVGTAPIDVGTAPIDVGTAPIDVGTAPIDVGTAPIDVGTPPIDVGTPPIDVGTPPVDVGTPPVDVGTPPMDAGSCPGGRAFCSGVCVDTQSDGLNCGRCGRGCSTGEVCAAGACATALRGLVISELRPASVPYIELYNGGNAPIDLLNHRVQWSTEMGGSGSVTLPTFTLAAGAFVILRGDASASGPGSLSLGTDLAWSTNIAVRLLAPSGQGLDFVRTGISTAAAPAGTTWIGVSTPNPTAETDQVLVRGVYSPDTDSAADWSLQSAPSAGSYCARPGRCGTTCVDLDADQNNCGTCGFRCTGSQTCRSGVCVGGVGRPWISEYRLHGRPAVEIHNPSARAIALAGYRLQVAPVSGTTLSFFLPARTLPPGGFVVLYAGVGTDDATSLYTGMTAGFGANVALSLFDETSTGIDFVRLGTSGMTPPAGQSWFGATVTAPSTTFDQSIKRDVSAFDTDSAADWVLSGPATPGYLCHPGLTICGGRCVDRALDRNHCGACDAACGPQQTCITGVCRSIGGLVFSELAASTQSFELFNGTAAAINLGTYILDWVADGGSATYTVPAGTMLAPGGFIRFRPGAGTSSANDLFMGAMVTVNWTSYLAVSVRTPLNVGVDFVKTGASPTPPPAGTTWAGATATNPSRATGESLARNLWGVDTNTAADWSIAASATPLAYCPTPSASTVMCGTACTDLQSSGGNCGACGNTCTTGNCSTGQCTTVPLRLYHGWASPLSGCTTAGYNATAATVLGGTYPYNSGDSSACRAWKLAATICTSQPVAYIDVNNWSCPSSGGFTDPLFGTYCAAASQYSCSTCPGACNAGTCRGGSNTLRNCSGLESTQF